MIKFVSVGVVSAAAAIALAPSAQAMCPFTPKGPVVLTTADSTLAADAGVLVGWGGAELKDDEGGQDPSHQAKWTADAGGKPVALVLTTLAPGLTLYKPATPVKGKLTLHAAGGAKVVAATIGTATAAALPAPDAKNAKRSEWKGPRWTSYSVTVDVGAVPDDAVALIMSSTGTSPHPLSFGRVAHDKPTNATIPVYDQDGHCGSSLGISEDPGAGSTVTFAWVDRAGHVSPASKPVHVGS